MAGCHHTREQAMDAPECPLCQRAEIDDWQSRAAGELEDNMRLRDALRFIVDLEPGSRGAYSKFAQAQTRAREALCNHNNQRQGERGPAYCADCGATVRGSLRGAG